MRLPLATDFKTRTGFPDKDAKLKNSYVEVKGQSAWVRKRPSAHGGVTIGTGIAQGMIGYYQPDPANPGGAPIPYVATWNGDTQANWHGGSGGVGTTWNSGTAYSTGDMASVDFTDYWATSPNTNSQPPNSNWNTTYVPPIPAPPVTYATLNPADRGTYITLSNGNLTATFSAPSTTTGLVRSTIGKSSGKWYWEVTVNSISASWLDDMGSVVNTSSANGMVGFDSNGWSRTTPFGGGGKMNGGASSAFGSNIIAGDVIGIYLDMTNKVISVSQNGGGEVLMFTGLSGTQYAGLGFKAASGESPSMTVNFGATPFIYPVPGGYNAGLYQ